MRNYASFLLIAASLLVSMRAEATIMDPKKYNQNIFNAAKQFFLNMENFTIKPKELSDLIKESEAQAIKPFVIIDVRDQKYFSNGHLPHAVNVPLDSLTSDVIKHYGRDKKIMIYVYCVNSSCDLGSKAAKKIADLGYPVIEMRGGFESWKNEVLPGGGKLFVYPDEIQFVQENGISEEQRAYRRDLYNRYKTFKHRENFSRDLSDPDFVLLYKILGPESRYRFYQDLSKEERFRLVTALDKAKKGKKLN